ncbi:MAG: hypothetical protein ACKVOI_19825 [Dongiaceae bacterium]
MSLIIGGIQVKPGDYVVFVEGKGYLISVDSSGKPTIIELSASQAEDFRKHPELIDCYATTKERPVVIRAKCA